MRYTLGGYAAPTAAGPTFLIPYFVRRGSNTSFVQQLDDNRTISAFMPFDATSVPRTFPPATVLHREEGDVAVMGFIDADDNLIIGTAPEVEATLSSTRLDLTESPFIEFELLQFLGRKAEASAAAGRAASTFQDSAAAELWKTAELASNARAPRIERPDTEIDQILGHLSSVEDEGKWARRWTRAWNKFPNDPKLERAAISWLGSAQSNKRGSSVLYQLLNARVVSQDTLQTTRSWLDTRHPTKWWSRVFTAALRNFDESEPLVRRAIDLTTKGGLGEVGNNQWVRIWIALRDRLGPSRELLNAARLSLPRLTGGMGKAAAVFDMCVADFPIDCRGSTVLGEWFDRPRGNLWAEIFLRIPGEGTDATLAAMGIEWLRANPTELRNWVPLWSSLLNTQPSLELYELGNRYVTEGRPTAHGWPVVLITLLADGRATPESTMLAMRWLDVNKGHVLHGRVRFLIEHPS